MQRVLMNGADLRSANMDRAELSGAHLHGANLQQANLSGADLSHADLNGAIGTTRTQLARAMSLKGATMPDGSIHP
jgi:uncharacterized protein YjbI with pentapeptide repeats